MGLYCHYTFNTPIFYLSLSVFKDILINSWCLASQQILRTC